MSPRRPVLPGPTSAERRGLDTGRGGGLEGGGLGEGRGRPAGTVSLLPARWVCPKRPWPLPCAPRRRGSALGWRMTVGIHQPERPSPPNLYPRVSHRTPRLHPGTPPSPFSSWAGGDAALRSEGAGSGLGRRRNEFRTVTKMKKEERGKRNWVQIQCSLVHPKWFPGKSGIPAQGGPAGPRVPHAEPAAASAGHAGPPEPPLPAGRRDCAPGVLRALVRWGAGNQKSERQGAKTAS